MVFFRIFILSAVVCYTVSEELKGVYTISSCSEICSKCDGIPVFEDGHCECQTPNESKKAVCLQLLKRESKEDMKADSKNAELNDVKKPDLSTMRIVRRLIAPVDKKVIADYFMNGGPWKGSSPFIGEVPPCNSEEDIKNEMNNSEICDCTEADNVPLTFQSNMNIPNCIKSCLGKSVSLPKLAPVAIKPKLVPINVNKYSTFRFPKLPRKKIETPIMRPITLDIEIPEPSLDFIMKREFIKLLELSKRASVEFVLAYLINNPELKKLLHDERQSSPLFETFVKYAADVLCQMCVQQKGTTDNEDTDISKRTPSVNSDMSFTMPQSMSNINSNAKNKDIYDSICGANAKMDVIAGIPGEVTVQRSESLSSDEVDNETKSGVCSWQKFKNLKVHK